MRTAILVDGGFYRKRAKYLWGKKTPEKRAAELWAYCSAHLKHEQKFDDRSLYRILWVKRYTILYCSVVLIFVIQKHFHGQRNSLTN